MTNTPSEHDPVRVALDGVAKPPQRAAQYGPAAEWAHRVGTLEPAEILHRTAAAPDGTSIEDRRNALLGQVDGARAEYEKNQTARARFENEFPSGGRADGARPATGSRVERPSDGALRKG